LLNNGELKHRVRKLNKILECCTLCPRRCKVNRKKSKKRYCNTAYKPIISSYQRDFGEDNELVGQNGTGALFFSNCNLHFVFYQNYQISQNDDGKEIPGV